MRALALARTRIWDLTGSSSIPSTPADHSFGGQSWLALSAFMGACMEVHDAVRQGYRGSDRDGRKGTRS
jgi:hypothetical protein